MHIDFASSGGYGGLQLSFRGTTEDLPDEEARDLKQAVTDSGVWDLSQSDIPAEPEGPADVMSYRLSLRDGNRQNTLHVTDVTAPESLRPLLALLHKLALKQRGR